MLVEAGDKTALFDPGNYSYDSGLIDVEALPELNYLVITHEHADHFYLPLSIQICKKYPSLTVITTKSVAAQLQDKVVIKLKTDLDVTCELFTAPHENLPAGSPPENIGVHFAGLFTHPGDSHSFTSSKEVLAMPMTAPWGSMTAAVQKILELKPKHVVPIHDWHWRPEALTGMYALIQGALKEAGINFIIPVDGQTIKL